MQSPRTALRASRIYVRNRTHAEKFKKGTLVQFINSQGTKWLSDNLWEITGTRIMPETEDFEIMHDPFPDLRKRASFTMRVTLKPVGRTFPHVHADPTDVRIPIYKPNGKLSPK